jgi:hypothetical protein
MQLQLPAALTSDRPRSCVADLRQSMRPDNDHLFIGSELVACRRVTITTLLASKLSWLVTATGGSPRNSIPN